ncbi:hypothetical protein N7516_005426 [Penicillium verrucosum]|nr:uncharacterized protein N7516_005426 [Penicillium verrucosum]KAJ5945258.1 hypothetical protein N7516_005426 [Penicillium verrucosum]
MTVSSTQKSLRSMFRNSSCSSVAATHPVAQGHR